MKEVVSTPSEKVVSRLILYRRVIADAAQRSMGYLRSHELGQMAGVSAAQVRRDLMCIGYEGSPQRGYNTTRLLDSLAEFLDLPKGQEMALIGVGNLGRALLSYFYGRRPSLSISVAFDLDPQKIDRVIFGCRCYPASEIEAIITERKIKLAVLAVPANVAQETVDILAACGIRGVLNFAPVALQVPESLYLDNLDVTLSLEKVAFFSRQVSKGG